MTVLSKQLLGLCALPMFVLGYVMAHEKPVAADTENGTLIVLVTWGDISNTPADDVYVEAHSLNAKAHDQVSVVLKMVRPGHYESSLPLGVYDVFISEGNSVPRCKRVLIRSKMQNYWTLKLEDDEVYTSR